MSRTLWNIGPGGGAPVRRLDALQDLLLTQRGVLKAEQQNFLDPRYERDIHDPYLMSGMRIAVQRIFAAIDAGEHVLVYGDYDVDGVTGTAVVVQTLRRLGARAVPYLPHRLDEGYGLNLNSLKEMVSEFDLLITVDCGISNAREIAWLKRQKKDVIVVDHHSLPDVLPTALAILHPALGNQYPFPYLSGAGVGWKLACALLRHGAKDRVNPSEEEIRLLDLVCLGTVADMVPLIGENRALVTFGLRILGRTQRLGLKLLLDSVGKQGGEVNSDILSFRVIPTLNAAGRLDHAQPAFDILLSEDLQKARLLVTRLRTLNTARQSLGRRILQEAELQVKDGDSFILVSDLAWQPGVLGLVAGRLSERFGVPAVAVGGHNGMAIGSARSSSGINILEFLLGAREHFLKIGGHAQAAGFSLPGERIGKLKRALLQQTLPATPAVRERYADALLAPHLVTPDTADLLERFAPYGMGNNRPVFIGKKLRLGEWRPVGKTHDHAKCTFVVDGRSVDGIGFGLAAAMKHLKDDIVDVLFNLETNEFRGRRALQLRVNDIVSAGSVRIAENKL